MTGDPAPDDGPLACAYCGRRFARAEWLALHRGLDHSEAIGPAEREAFEEAYRAEEPDLRFFRLKALAALVVLYFGFLIVYAIVTP